MADELITGKEQIISEIRRTAPQLMTPGGGVRTLDHGAVLQQSDGSEMSARFTIVTRGKDPNLHGNKVQIAASKLGDGLRLDMHEQNPVVLLEHGFVSPFPIGQSETPQGKHALKVQKSKAVADVFFSEHHPDHSIVFGLVDDKVLRMASIGFVPFKAQRFEMEHDDLPEGVEPIFDHFGLDFVESLLLEWSIVANGADTGALAQMLDRGHLHGEKLTPQLSMFFQRIVEPERKVWSAGWGNDGGSTVTLNVSGDADPDEIKQILQDSLCCQTGGGNPGSGSTVKQAIRETARTPTFSGTETRSDQPWGDVDKSLRAFIRGLLSGVDEGTEWSDLSQQQRNTIARRTLLGNANAETAADGIAFPVVNPSNDSLNQGGLIAAKAAAGGARGSDLPQETSESVVSVVDRLLEEHFSDGDEDEDQSSGGTAGSENGQGRKRGAAKHTGNMRPAGRRKPRKGDQMTDHDPIRWNPMLSQSFDVASEYLEASKLEYEWVSRYVGCQVKQLHDVTYTVPSLRMGSFLTGLRYALETWKLDDTRNLTFDAKEIPPSYEIVQLDSRQRDDFLVSGLQFMHRGGDKLVLKRSPSWSGIKIRVYTERDRMDLATEVVGQAATWAAENNFLKGEAFSLSGKFLPQTQESFDGLFLKPENLQAVQSVSDHLNRKGRHASNRGMLMLGPPGTGKTLSGRILRNQTQATFIWLSARDFYRMGAFGGLGYGFDLARELAPSVLFIEDVDNWMSPRTTDLLKTEMDGISRSSGVVTILTTNYPERLPQALIDRPGRFHDVLKFDLPDEGTRAKMLAYWLKGDTAKQDRAIKEAASKTDGYSGAHIRELANFAQSVCEEDNIPLSQALTRSIEKIEEQRDLITSVQLQGSRYSPPEKFSLDQLKPLTNVVRFTSQAVDSKTASQDSNTQPVGEYLAKSFLTEPERRQREREKRRQAAEAFLESVVNRVKQRVRQSEERKRSVIQKGVQEIDECAGILQD